MKSKEEIIEKKAELEKELFSKNDGSALDISISAFVVALEWVLK
jgi:hypothetical protein